MDDGSLRITDTETADQGDYICSASNTIKNTVKTATATAGLTVFSKSSSFFGFLLVFGFALLSALVYNEILDTLTYRFEFNYT